MQNRYVGDLGDYGKYGLLRHLASPMFSSSPLRLAVMWYLVPEQHYEANNDGKHVGYLHKEPPVMRVCDPELFDALRHLVAKRRRKVAGVEKAGLFPRDTVFFGKPLYPEKYRTSWWSRPFERDRWITEGLDRTGDADIVFFDPDNGIEPKSINRRNAPKYVLWDELRQFHGRGQSLVIYHHLNRNGTHDLQISEMLKRTREEFPDAGTYALRYGRGTSRAFFIVAAERHEQEIRSALARLYESPWVTGQHFSRPAEPS